MKKVHLIFNPVSGAGHAPQELEQIRAKLLDQVELEVQFTSPEESATALAETAIAQGADLIIASGGDGTVSAVATVLMHSNIPLAVIPRGTANAFAAALDIPTAIDQACDVILQGQPQQIDCATCNGQPMILLAGIGLEAATIGETDRDSKQRFGFFAYLSTAVQQLQKLQPFQATLDFGDRQQTFDDVLAITVANLAPSTSILAQGTGGASGQDALLDVTVLTMADEGELFGLLSASYELFQAALQDNPADHPHIQSWRTAELTVTTMSPQALLLDGELLEEITTAQFAAVPRSLWVQLPPKAATPPEESP
ncbi:MULTISPECIES: YegS/Rv2252/BmrU family lipid kinase, partial [unclassified Picosynechococcus]|uniref:YegS/Rv2252/BmrU family lipid kinase n=1 Tax=unclassified Picosynechococcus TaxID=3079910 RepID=UPI0004A9F532